MAENGVVQVLDGVLVPPPPVIGRMSVVNGNLAIQWTGGGEIEVANALDGPWLSGGHVGGLLVVPMETGSLFFRIRLGPSGSPK